MKEKMNFTGKAGAKSSRFQPNGWWVKKMTAICFITWDFADVNRHKE